MSGPRIGVFGIGNVLMGDDAVGPWAVCRFAARWDLPDEVIVEDLGTPGLDLHPHFLGLESLVLVDSVRSTRPAGDVRCYDKARILRHLPGTRLGPHDPGLKAALLGLEFAGQAPRNVWLVGVVPGRVSADIGLSAEVRAAWPRIERGILDGLLSLGVLARRPSRPRCETPWWEATPVGASP